MSDHDQDAVARQIDFRMWREVLRFALGQRRTVVIWATSALGLAICDASFGYLTKLAVDDVTLGTGSRLPWIAAGYATAALTLSVLVWVFIRTAARLANGMSHDIRDRCFRRLQELEFAFFDERSAGWLISRLTSDCDRLARMVAWGMVDLLWGPALVLAMAGVMLAMEWRLALLVMVIMPPLALFSHWFRRLLLDTAREVRRFNSRITASFNEAIQGVRTTKVLVREEAAQEEFGGLAGGMYDAAYLNARQSAFYQPVILAAGAVASGLALWAGGASVTMGAITLGTLVAFLQYAGQFLHPVEMMARVITEMQGAQAAGERVLGLLATTPAIQDGPTVRARLAAVAARGGPGPGEAPDGLPARIESIEFRDVGFAYRQGRRVLDGFHLRVRAGERLALVGPSGGGKTTIVSLVGRFYEPTEGAILVNGLDYRERPLEWYQGRLGIVLQQPHLFAGTIRENIRYGRLEATDEEVEAAARLVHADTFIREMENGYASEVGEGGSRLSTGQRQLVSFARAVLADPQILIMDEATSSIDTETEQLIQAGLERVLHGRISFVIAHRLSTIRHADRILVIEKGRITESGTHAELLALRGHYWDLYTGQYKREREEKALEEEAVA